MEGASSGLAWHLDDILPKDAQFVLDWNPPQLTARQKAGPILPSHTTHTANIGYTRAAAFYGRHLAPQLILERVVYFDTLVSTLASTVDQAIQDAVLKCPLPKPTGFLHSEELIKHQVRAFFRQTKWHKAGVAEDYSKHALAATYCLPLASTLAIHPSSEQWDTILNWTRDVGIGWWAGAGAGALVISTSVFKDDQWKQELLKNEDEWKNAIIEQLASRSITLAVWEMQNPTVGTAQGMEEIVEIGLTRAKFPWKKCTTTADCTNHLWEDMEESRKGYDAGFDARSPPWTLPDVPFASAAVNSRPTPLRDGPRNASAQRDTTSRSYKVPSLSPTADGERFREKRRRNDSNASEYYEQPALKKSKADSMDERDKSYEPPPGSRKETIAQSFLQQTWAQAVRNKCTIMVLHSGNHEIIGIRHRKTQTLYVSHVIEPHSCSDPAYGKIQVGIYIAAVQETIDRARQDIEAREKRSRDPSADISLRNEEANPDGDLDDYPPERPTRSNKQSRGSGIKSKQQGRHEENAKHHASGKDINDQVLLANAARQNHLCLRFFYDIYDSPHPAAFRRVLDEPTSKETPGPAEPQTPPPPGRETMPLSVPSGSIHITLHSELQPGSTGIVHIGTMAVNQSGPGPTAKVAVKLAFSRDEKSRLIEEHRVYSHLHSRGVQEIPCNIGLFVDEEPLLGAEGPYALILSYAGVSLFGRSKQASDSVKYSLLATLRSIHRADILHGDIRLPNLCVTASGEAFVVDFSHATKNRSRKVKAREIKDLAYVLGMNSPPKPAAKDLEKPVVLRRSARIKELQRKSKVEPKNEQVKRGKSTRRK